MRRFCIPQQRVKLKLTLPIGNLGDIEVHFLHYKTQKGTGEVDKARQPHKRDNLFVIYSDGGGQRRVQTMIMRKNILSVLEASL
jgi:uncharacterized protein (DUF1919 family)